MQSMRVVHVYIYIPVRGDTRRDNVRSFHGPSSVA